MHFETNKHIYIFFINKNLFWPRLFLDAAEFHAYFRNMSSVIQVQISCTGVQLYLTE